MLPYQQPINDDYQQLPPPQNDVEQNQNPPNPFIVHQAVIEMFPELDLTQTLYELGNMPSNELVLYIVENAAKIPKKQKRKVEEIAPFTPEIVADTTISEENVEDDGSDLLIDKLLAELLHTIKVEMRENRGQPLNRNHLEMMKKFLAEKFLGARMEFITRMLKYFNNAMLPTAIACFLSENQFGYKILEVTPDLSGRFINRITTKMVSRRPSNRPQLFPLVFNDEFKQYTDLMRKHQQGEYRLLLTPELKLSPQYNLIKWERKEQGQHVECLVCLERFPKDHMVYCSAPAMSEEDFFAALAQETQIGSSRMFEQTTSKAKDRQLAINEFGEGHSRMFDQTTSTAKEKNEVHAFCRGCVRGQAEAATQEIPLAEGGVGLCCMAPGCKNPILYAEIRTLLKWNIRKKLDERILEENIGMASIINLERCKRCNFAMEMEVDKEINKVFECLNCGTSFCRLCEREWNDDHFGITCEELDIKTNQDRKARELEKQCNEAIIRKCPRCKIAFVKEVGCNKMTCRCGMTQCYLCRESGINYNHFCQHLRNPDKPDEKCKSCNKTCLLYTDASKQDEQALREIRLNAERAEREEQAAAGGGSNNNTSGTVSSGPSTEDSNTEIEGDNDGNDLHDLPRPLNRRLA